MKSKFGAFFTENIWMKILSVLVGVAIWAVLSNAQDPTVSKTINIPVTYINGDQLIREEQHVLLSGPDTVQITATARQSNLSRLRADLFTCTADLMDHGGGDLKSQRVHVSVTQVSGWDVVIDWNYYRSDPNITVVMDDYIEKTFPIGILTSSSLSEGLVLKDSIFSVPETVTISGPLTRFGNIAAVKASVDLEQLSDLGAGTFKLHAPLRLYDANDNVVTNSDGALKFETENVQITATIAREGTVQIKAAGVSGAPKDGCRFSSMSIRPNTISVHGMNDNTVFSEIVIPAADININGISEDTVYEVDITKYLPEGIVLDDGISPTVQVTVSVEQQIAEQIPIPREYVSIENQNAQYIYALDGNVTALYVRGYREELASFNTVELNPWVSVNGLEAGRHTVKVNITQLPGFVYENAGALYVTVVITPAETTPPETQPVPTQPSDTPSESSDDTESEPSPESSSEDPTQPSQDPEETEPPETDPENG